MIDKCILETLKTKKVSEVLHFFNESLIFMFIGVNIRTMTIDLTIFGLNRYFIS